MKNLKIALNLYMLKTLDRMTKAQYNVQQIGGNPAVFTNSAVELPAASAAIAALQAAVTDAKGGDSYKIGIMHEKDALMLEAMGDLVKSVQKLPGLTLEMILLAGFDVRKTGGKTAASGLEVSLGDGALEVKLKVKAQEDSFYKWEYCLDPLTSNTWVEAKGTTASSTTLTVPAPGFYWFRVVFVQPLSEHEQEPVKFAVN